MSEWLDRLEVGDLVILSHRVNQYEIMKIERFTKTQIVLEGISAKFRRSDGYRVGAHGWYSCNIIEAKPEMVAEIKGKQMRKAIIKKIKDFNFSKCGTDHLERILKSMEG